MEDHKNGERERRFLVIVSQDVSLFLGAYLSVTKVRAYRQQDRAWKKSIGSGELYTRDRAGRVSERF